MNNACLPNKVFIDSRVCCCWSSIFSDFHVKYPCFLEQNRLQISGPSDFSHISHLGPGSGPFTSNLIDCEYMLPVCLFLSN